MKKPSSSMDLMAVERRLRVSHLLSLAVVVSSDRCNPMKTDMKPAYLGSQQKGPTFSSIRSCVLACALLIGAGYAQAHLFCVSTATELQGALTAASDGGAFNGEDNYIHVFQGTYMVGSATGGGPFHYHSTASSGQMNLLGGFDVDCFTPTGKASQTVLDGNHSAQVLSIRSSTADISVINFTIQNGETSQVGAGLAVNFVSGDNSGAVIQRNIIRNNHTTGQAGGLFVITGAGPQSLYVQNNLITGNSADSGFGAGKVIGFGSDTDFDNCTVTRNTTTLAGGAGGLYFSGGALAYVDNSIFWNNTNAGIYLGNSNVRMEYNDYGTLGGAVPFTSVGNVSVGPSFVDGAGGDFHLTGDSPLLGKSPELFNRLDPDGNPSPEGGKIDIGAYNETIFIDGLDGG
jgi:hypothetical protein